MPGRAANHAASRELEQGLIAGALKKNYNAFKDNLQIFSSFLQETDSALLPIIGFPAFAVDDAMLIDLTAKTLHTTLEGSYGFKRFLRDGYRTVNEDPNRLHYNSFELKKFEGLECEWPVLFGFVILSAFFRNDVETATKYMRKLERHLIPRVSVLRSDVYVLYITRVLFLKNTTADHDLTP